MPAAGRGCASLEAAIGDLRPIVAESQAIYAEA